LTARMHTAGGAHRAVVVWRLLLCCCAAVAALCGAQAAAPGSRSVPKAIAGIVDALGLDPALKGNAALTKAREELGLEPLTAKMTLREHVHELSKELGLDDGSGTEVPGHAVPGNPDDMLNLPSKEQVMEELDRAPKDGRISPAELEARLQNISKMHAHYMSVNTQGEPSLLEEMLASPPNSSRADFREIDTDGDDALTLAELRAYSALHGAGVSGGNNTVDAQISPPSEEPLPENPDEAAHFAHADQNGDAKLDFREFLRYHFGEVDVEAQRVELAARKYFAEADADADGAIDTDELDAALQQHSWASQIAPPPHLRRAEHFRPRHGDELR